MQGIRTKPEPYCPDCGARMTLRRPRQGQTWMAFWGCARYPDCHGKRSIQANGEPEPDDDFDDYRLPDGARLGGGA